MIVQAAGIMGEKLLPRGDRARPERAAATEWLVVTSDRRLRAELLEAVARHGGFIRDRDALERRSWLAPVDRRHAFVDLVAAEDGVAPGFLEQQARSWGAVRPKLIVRGGDGDTAGELLARRAGAVAYLSGDLRPGFLASLIAEISS